MTDFNIVAEIGGVDTSDPARPYKPDEQKAVLNYIFGDDSPQGSLMLPNGQELYVGNWKTSENYSIGIGSGIYHGLPALFVPKIGERAMLFMREGGDSDENGLDRFEGFLPVSIGKLLLLGKHSMQEIVAGKRIDFKKQASPEHAQARDYLTQYVIGDALFSSDEDVSEDEMDNLGGSMSDFLGKGLAELERQGITDGEGGAFEEFTIELMRRICLVTCEKRD